MGKAISVPQREVIFERAGLGHKIRQIADDLGRKHGTVRKLVTRLTTRGASAVAPDHFRCGVVMHLSPGADLIEAAIRLRREHLTWGAGILRVVLAEQFPTRHLPSERTIQRAFAKAKLNPAPAGRRQGGPPRRAQMPHETGRIDAADQMKRAGTGQARWLRVVDECTGAVLETAVFPPRALQYGRRWRDPGDPPPLLHPQRATTVDNGTPWRLRGDLPTGLELWLAGLGVEVWANTPRRPLENGVVERSQGTGQRWPQPHRADSAEQLQATIDAMDRRQREAYPYRDGRSRLATPPGLKHSGRLDNASHS